MCNQRERKVFIHPNGTQERAHTCTAVHSPLASLKMQHFHLRAERERAPLGETPQFGLPSACRCVGSGGAFQNSCSAFCHVVTFWLGLRLSCLGAILSPLVFCLPLFFYIHPLESAHWFTHKCIQTRLMLFMQLNIVSGCDRGDCRERFQDLPVSHRPLVREPRRLVRFSFQNTFWISLVELKLKSPPQWGKVAGGRC